MLGVDVDTQKFIPVSVYSLVNVHSCVIWYWYFLWVKTHMRIAELIALPLASHAS